MKIQKLCSYGQNNKVKNLYQNSTGQLQSSKSASINSNIAFCGNSSDTNPLKYIGLGIAAVTLLLGGVKSCTKINPGMRGVTVRLGKVQNEVLGEGLHFKMPFIDDIIPIDVKTHKLSLNTQSYTKDMQEATILCNFNFNPKPENANRLFQKVGLDYEDKFVTSDAEEVLKNVIGQYKADDLIAQRKQASAKILEELKATLKDKDVELTDVQLKNVSYSDKFEQAIEEKVMAEQEALRAQNKTRQIAEEGKQKVIQAGAEADAIRTNAFAQAEAIRIKGEALRNNPGVVSLELIQQWDGHLPQYMGGDATPLINLTNPVK